MILEKAAALAQQHRMRHRPGHVAQRGTGHAEKVDVHADEMLPHDVQTRLGQELVHIRHPPICGVLDRKHGVIRVAPMHHVDGPLEGRRGERFEAR